MRNEVVSKVKKFVGNSAKKAAKFSGDAIDYTKLRIKLFEIRDELDGKYAQVGKIVYEGNEDADVEKICDEITALREQEADIKEKMSVYQSKKTCPECGASVDSKSEYCSSCGNKF